MLSRVLLCASLAALLADAGPSCGSRHNGTPLNPAAFLSVKGPKCSCVLGSVDILVDGRSLGQVACDATLLIEVVPGEHTVTGGGKVGVTWQEHSISVNSGTTSPVDLGCPATTGG